MTAEDILRVENLYKLFIPLESFKKEDEAMQLLKSGHTRSEVLQATGITAGLTDINFNVKKGEIFVLIGLSGSGKSTLVRCLNMLHKPSYGSIYFENRDITKFTSGELQEFRRRKISMVFQSFGLMDNRNVLENTYYGLEIRGVPKKERENKALEMLAMVGLEGWEHKKISELSGGMKQRVGIARALTNDPDILLMDEAFSALDPLVKNDLQFELLRIQEKMDKTIVFITHDINEAFRLGNRVGILRDGRMVQIASPEEMITSPADQYVRNFINNVNSSKVFTVHNIMTTPTCMVRISDGAGMALKSMQSNGVSSAYVIGEHLEFIGLITIESALKVLAGYSTFNDAIFRNIPVIDNIDAPLADIMPIAANTPYPLAVVDKEHHFRGIVTKASVLSSIVLDNPKVAL